MFQQVQDLCPRELRTQFHNLPQDAILNILSRMPVVGIIRSRLVSKRWRAMLSSPLSGPSELSSSFADFLKTFWVENRPVERWLFLYTERILNYSLLYDVQHNICYHWRPNPELARLLTLADPRATLCNTTAHGLIFLTMLRRDVPANPASRPGELTIWAYNPLTGCQDQLPGVTCNNIPFLIVANNDVIATTNLEPHYKVLVLWDNIESLRTRETQKKHDVLLYSSKERSWQRHDCFSYTRVITYLCEVKRFYEHDMIYILEKSHNRFLVGYHSKAILRWFNVEDYSWHSCKLCPPEPVSMENSLEFYDLFERNKELILLSVLVDFLTGNFELRVYKSSSTIEAGVQIAWVSLSSKMGKFNVTSGQRVAERCGIPSTERPTNISYDDVHIQVFPLPDEAEGDKLIIIVMHRRLGSFSVTSFNFKSLQADAWKDLIRAGNLHDQLTTPGERIGQWTWLTRHPRWTIQSGPSEGFSFEPRLDYLQEGLLSTSSN